MRNIWLILIVLFVFACSSRESKEISPKKIPVSSSSVESSSSEESSSSLRLSLPESSSSSFESSSSKRSVFPLKTQDASGAGEYKAGQKVLLGWKAADENLCFNGMSVSPSKYAKALKMLSADSASFTMPADSVFISANFKSCLDGIGTLVIGKLRWTNQNLNIWTLTGSSCYEKKSSNCRKYGRLYDFETAKKICPKGWRLPTDADWDSMKAALGENDGAQLKSREGWENDEETSGNGTDAKNFHAIPAGIVYEGSYMYRGFHAYYWTASERDETTAFYRSISYDSPESYRYYNFKTAGYSVRCVQDVQ